MYLLDTNICIYAMKDKYPALSKRLFQIPPSDIFISSVTVSELEYGCGKSNWGNRSRNVMNLFLSAFTIIPFDEKDARIAGRVRAELMKSGTPIGPYDIQIAAQGLSRGLTVITHNTKEFERIPELKLQDWVL